MGAGVDRVRFSLRPSLVLGFTLVEFGAMPLGAWP
jgi:hypothetical protein